MRPLSFVAHSRELGCKCLPPDGETEVVPVELTTSLQYLPRIASFHSQRIHSDGNIWPIKNCAGSTHYSCTTMGKRECSCCSPPGGDTSPHVEGPDINRHRARTDHSRVRKRTCARSAAGDCAVSSAIPVKSWCDLHSVPYERRRGGGRAPCQINRYQETVTSSVCAMFSSKTLRISFSKPLGIWKMNTESLATISVRSKRPAISVSYEEQLPLKETANRLLTPPHGSPKAFVSACVIVHDCLPTHFL
eukprot:SAG31_NODE_2652_length_5296_cov_7.770637_2_plen_248_part_00